MKDLLDLLQLLIKILSEGAVPPGSHLHKAVRVLFWYLGRELNLLPAEAKLEVEPTDLATTPVSPSEPWPVPEGCNPPRLQHWEKDPVTNSYLTEKEKRLVHPNQGGRNKLEAIKEVRARAGIGLKEAKELVERYMPTKNYNHKPELKDEYNFNRILIKGMQSNLQEVLVLTRELQLWAQEHYNYRYSGPPARIKVDVDDFREDEETQA